MEVEAVRQAGNLQTLFKDFRRDLENHSTRSAEIYGDAAKLLVHELGDDSSRIIDYIQIQLDWPLKFRRVLLREIRRDLDDQPTALTNLADFFFNPTKNLQRGISKPSRRFHLTLPTIGSLERQYGSGICSIFHLQYGFFLMNLFTLIVWLGVITIPYLILRSSKSVSDAPFEFVTIFTGKGFLARSIFFQGFYSDQVLRTHYDPPLIYLAMSYVYFFLWFVFLTIRFSSAYKQKVLKSILNNKSGNGFMSTFANYDYTSNSIKTRDRYRAQFERQYRDLIGNDERTKQVDAKRFRSKNYKLKIIVTNLFNLLLGLTLGAINWMILSFCSQANVDCTGSLMYLVLVNRLVPYLIVFMAQIEQYKYLSYKLDAVGFRCVWMHICTILSFIIYFFTHAPPCYETAFGQYIYILLLADLMASLIFPFVFGLLLDLLAGRRSRDFDGINLHVQLSPPVLLYSQFLIWLGTYFSPMLSIMILFNLFFSFLSHRLYLQLRSHQSHALQRLFIWNAQRLNYMFYLFAYILLIISVTAFAVFTTQISPSVSCGPFRSLNASYEVIGQYLDRTQTSVLWVSLVSFLTSPGLIYFLGIIFFVIAYKLRQEGLAEKQLVFIRESNLDSKKNMRQRAVQRLHEQQQVFDPSALPSAVDVQMEDDEDEIIDEQF